MSCGPQGAAPQITWGVAGNRRGDDLPEVAEVAGGDGGAGGEEGDDGRHQVQEGGLVLL